VALGKKIIIIQDLRLLRHTRFCVDIASKAAGFVLMRVGCNNEVVDLIISN